MSGSVITVIGTSAPIPDVVDGRLDYVSTTQIKYSFLRSNQIRLFDGTNEQLVQLTAEPTLANNATDLNGDALIYAVVYDIFAKWNSATAMDLVCAPWSVSTAGASARQVTWASNTAYKIGDRMLHTSNYYACILAHGGGGAGNDKEPGVTANWQNYWLDCGTVPSNTDFKGLYQYNGSWVYGPNYAGATVFDGRKYRWLGVIITYNDTGSKYRNTAYSQSIGNYYNAKATTVVTYNTTASWTYNTATWRECNAGTGQVQGLFVSAFSQNCVGTIAEVVDISNAAYYADVALGVSSTSVPSNIATWGGGIVTAFAMVAAGTATIGKGYQYVTQLEEPEGAYTITNYGNQEPFSHGAVNVFL
jgi:hypothetical protein